MTLFSNEHGCLVQREHAWTNLNDRASSYHVPLPEQDLAYMLQYLHEEYLSSHAATGYSSSTSSRALSKRTVSAINGFHAQPSRSTAQYTQPDPSTPDPFRRIPPFSHAITRIPGNWRAVQEQTTVAPSDVFGEPYIPPPPPVPMSPAVGAAPAFERMMSACSWDSWYESDSKRARSSPGTRAATPLTPLTPLTPAQTRLPTPSPLVTTWDRRIAATARTSHALPAQATERDRRPSTPPPPQLPRLPDVRQPSAKALGKRRAVEDYREPEAPVVGQPSAKALGKRRAQEIPSKSRAKRSRSTPEGDSDDEEYIPQRKKVKRETAASTSTAGLHTGSSTGKKPKGLFGCLIKGCPKTGIWDRKTRWRHMDTHFDERYKCPGCNKVCPRLDALRRHCTKRKTESAQTLLCKKLYESGVKAEYEMDVHAWQKVETFERLRRPTADDPLFPLWQDLKLQHEQLMLQQRRNLQ